MKPEEATIQVIHNNGHMGNHKKYGRWQVNGWLYLWMSDIKYNFVFVVTPKYYDASLSQFHTEHIVLAGNIADAISESDKIILNEFETIKQELNKREEDDNHKDTA